MMWLGIMLRLLIVSVFVEFLKTEKKASRDQELAINKVRLNPCAVLEWEGPKPQAPSPSYGCKGVEAEAVMNLGEAQIY
jgi:hypothetical protein